MKTNTTHQFLLRFFQKIRLKVLFACLFFSPILQATSDPSLENWNKGEQNTLISTPTQLSLGTPASFLEQLGINEIAAKNLSLNDNITNSQSNLGLTNFTLVDNEGGGIEVVAENFFLETNGTLSMNGHATGIPNSEFILQGNENNVYGWIILRDRNLAYEYTTVGKNLVVDEIAITDVHPVCDFEHHKHDRLIATTKHAFQYSLSDIPHIGPYPGTHVGQLESKPGSSYVILLDTRRVMSNGIPYDVSKEFIWTTWQIVAASFSMFDVNVTTNQRVYDNAAPSRRGGATMYRESGRSSCHFAFGTSTFCTLYRESDAYGQGRIAAHEIGHLLHLAHDGGYPGGEYYNGIPEFEWVPVMGNIWMGTSWNNALYQWSKGEYSGASNREDDFVKINRFIPFKPDDISNTKALIIDSGGNVSAANNIGQIEYNTDSDSFAFSIGSSGGHVNLTIDRAEHIGGGMLDVHARIKDASGNIVAQSNKSVNRSASFDLTLSAGNYTLEITGGAEGTPSRGFSKYSSLGYYAIEGTISGAGTGNDIPIINNIANGSTLSGSSQLFSWNSGDATEFRLAAGSSQGAEDYYGISKPTTDTSETATGLPTDGSIVHVTLHYLIKDRWSQSYYTYTAFDENNNGKLGITSPTEGETLSGSSQLFRWNPGNATGFWFYAGSSRGARDYYRNSSVINGTSHTVTGLPTDGSTVHITFHYYENGQWSQLYYTYKAANDGGSCTSAPATPNKPVNTANSSTSFTADWNSVSQATSYAVQLWVNDSEWQTVDTTSDSEYTFKGLPAGSTQYVRVNASNSCGSSYYSYWSEMELPSDGCTSAPAVPTGLNGSSRAISWNAVPGATRYDVEYWTGVWTYHGSSSSPSYSLGLSGTQYVRVRASNSCGNSQYSNWVTVY
ncbi:fibronectin type III domain-containing protein [Aliikangiella coralliicola]|uniref:Fibronectin type III domain-containing protein n=1 Tax=Aliikangiella coralliicola TaxID=2592383 RepID=A0A545U924_9GAMM|nr:fibronectin type III domain-containing protein [Aliikangiella coralliicola]TQV85913.1 fibronectin type III domain-containing protein [Aliikangiella coralliicola]